MTHQINVIYLPPSLNRPTPRVASDDFKYPRLHLYSTVRCRCVSVHVFPNWYK